MYIVITEAFLNGLLAARASDQTNGTLWGKSLDDGSVVQFLAFGEGDGRQDLGRWRIGDAPNDSDSGPLLALLDETQNSPVFYQVTPNGWVRQPHEFMNLYADYNSRQVGLFDNADLAKKRVAIVGLGTGGSIVATELAKAGVGFLRLADFDRLEVHNVSRHVCGVKDLGRLKTHAVRDHLRNSSPIVQVETYDFDITTDPDLLRQMLSDCDVVVGAADSEEAKGFLNRMAWEMHIPAVYGAAYNMGYGGDIFTALPPDGACYECFRNGTADIFDTQPKEEIADYGKIQPQPALEIDVGVVAFFLARAALAVLLRDDLQSLIQPYPTNWVIWGNQPWEGWLFDEPLQSKMIEVEPDEYCPVCHRDNYLRRELGLSEEDAKVAAANLLQDLSSAREG